MAATHPDITFANRLGIGCDVHLVACGQTKADRPTRAADLYTSSSFRRAYDFASTRGSLTGDGTAPVFIVSAKHGLLHPDTVVDPYDFALKQMSSAELQAWVERLREQLRAQGIERARFHVHGGAVYVEMIRRAVEPELGRVVNFFNYWRQEKVGREKGIGYRRGWYRQTAEREQAWREGRVDDETVARLSQPS